MSDQSGVDLQTVPDAQLVCKPCGICCRGVWFSHASLEPWEVDMARQMGFRPQTIFGKVAFPLPCALRGSDGCSVYEVWRPKPCVEYSCALLDRYVAGKVTLEEALSHVNSARAMVDRVQNEVGPSAGALFGKEFSSRVTESVTDEPTAFPPLSPAAKADTIALHFYFKKYFKK